MDTKEIILIFGTIIITILKIRKMNGLCLNQINVLNIKVIWHSINNDNNGNDDIIERAQYLPVSLDSRNGNC